MRNQRSISRRKALQIGGAAGLAGLAGCSGSGLTGDSGGSGYPSENTRMIIPYGTAGGYNAYARLVAKYLEENLPGDHSVNPDNVQGSGGRKATNTTYTAEPDGHTQMIVNINSFTRQQLVFDTQYDVTDMTYFAQVANSPQALAVSADSDIESWADFVEAGENGEIVFAGEGSGSTSSLLGKVIGEITGSYDHEEQNTVQFDGKSGVAASMERGETNAIGNPWDSLLPFVQNETMRYVLFIGDEAPEAIKEVQPDIDTLADTDYSSDVKDKMAALSHNRIFGGPPDIPEETVSTIREAYDQAINSDDLHNEAQEMNRPIAYRPGSEVSEVVETKFETWEPRQDLLESAMK
jgi:tripartite-type tricarboxylate transporter receptor subunit TctC